MSGASDYIYAGQSPPYKSALMSFHDIFDFAWNFPLPWFWILGGIGAIWLVIFLVGLVLINAITKGDRQ